MANLKDLPEIVFADSSKDKAEALIIGEYEKASGRSLSPADPVRIFLLAITAVIIMLLERINETGKQNLLRYASGDNLDHIGAMVGVERTPATAAAVTMQVNLSTELETATVIPAGTRFTAGDSVFFATAEGNTIPAGTTSGSFRAYCLEPGTIGNGYAIGSIDTLVDPIPYVRNVSNITASDGGNDKQDDESYREDIRMAPERYAAAGPEAAYIYHAKKASSLITDVSVISPSAGVVDVRPLLEGGAMPGEEILQTVRLALNDRRVRPLTDKVNVLAPTAANYNINLTYYINSDDSQYTEQIVAAVNKAVEEYISWQSARLGRDINPSELIARVMTAGAKRVNVTAPAYTVLSRSQVAKLGTKTVTLGAVEDD